MAVDIFTVILYLSILTFLWVFLPAIIGKFPVPLQKVKNPKRDLFDALLIWSVIAVMITAIFVAISFIFKIQVTSYPSMLLLAMIIVTLIPYLIFPYLYVKKFDNLGLKDLGISTVIREKKLLVYILIAGLLWSVLLAGGQEPIPILFALISIYWPAFIEEFVARGILQNKLERAFGRWTAIIGAAFLFTLWHSWNNVFGFNFQGTYIASPEMILLSFAGQFLAGIGLGIVYMKTRNLIPAIVMHYIMDFMPSVFAHIL
jgi:membrane protease YdiL (CAAX protease family)